MYTITVNAKAPETMLFIWASIKDKRKIRDSFLHELANEPEMAGAYDEDFKRSRWLRSYPPSPTGTAERSDPKESRFWNYNMWMLEDPDMTQMMLKPIKQLNLDEFGKAGAADFPYEDVEVIFYPGHFPTYKIIKNKLFINFFAVKADIWTKPKY